MDAVLPLTVAVPLLAAAILAGLGHLVPRRVADAFTILATGTTAALCLVVFRRAGTHDVVHWFGGWRPVRGLALGVDLAAGPLNAGLAALAAVLVLAAAVFAWRYFETVRTLSHVLILVFCAAMVGFALSGDLFNMFVFFELMSVAAYALTAYKSDEKGALQGALNFGVTNSVGAFLVLFAIALLYARTGALNLVQIGEALASRPADGLVVCALTLIVAGFLVKAAAVPFHFWLADAHAVAPTPACIIFSGVMVELGLYAVGRVYWTVFSGVLPPTDALRFVLVGAGVVTAVVGGVMCLSQHHLKRLLALSTVSHSGIILIGVGLLSASGVGGAAVYIVGHGLVKGALFVAAGVVLHRKGAIDDHHLHGRGGNLVVTAVLWFVGGAALAGLPPFATYLGKGLIDEAARKEHMTWVVVVTITASALTAAAVFRAGAHVFLGWGHVDEDATSEHQGRDEEQETEGRHGRTPVVMLAPAVVLLAAALALGVAPHLAHGTERAAERFTDRHAQVEEVLGGREVPPPPEATSPPKPSPSMVVYGLVSVVAAVFIAAIALWRRRLPEGLVRRTGRVGLPALRALRSVHSGHIGDYISWLTFGTALLGGLLALAARS